MSSSPLMNMNIMFGGSVLSFTEGTPLLKNELPHIRKVQADDFLLEEVICLQFSVGGRVCVELPALTLTS